jgi:hypothetical protein
MTEEPNEYGIETHHRQGGDPSQSQLSKAEDDGKQPTELQKSLTRKFTNEADFIEGVRPVRPLKKPTCSVGVKSSPVQWLQNSGQTQPSATELKLGARTKTQSWHVTARKSQEQIAESSMPILRIAKGGNEAHQRRSKVGYAKVARVWVQIAESLMPILRIAKGRKRSVPARKQGWQSAARKSLAPIVESSMPIPRIERAGNIARLC